MAGEGRRFSISAGRPRASCGTAGRVRPGRSPGAAWAAASGFLVDRAVKLRASCFSGVAEPRERGIDREVAQRSGLLDVGGTIPVGVWWMAAVTTRLHPAVPLDVRRPFCEPDETSFFVGVKSTIADAADRRLYDLSPSMKRPCVSYAISRDMTPAPATLPPSRTARILWERSPRLAACSTHLAEEPRRRSCARYVVDRLGSASSAPQRSNRPNRGRAVCNGRTRRGIFSSANVLHHESARTGRGAPLGAYG